MNEIWHMRCLFVCAGVHISISFIVFVYYIYIRYTIVMSCIGVYDFFSCTLKFQTMMYMKQNKILKEKKKKIKRARASCTQKLTWVTVSLWCTSIRQKSDSPTTASNPISAMDTPSQKHFVKF